MTQTTSHSSIKDIAAWHCVAAWLAPVACFDDSRAAIDVRKDFTRELPGTWKLTLQQHGVGSYVCRLIRRDTSIVLTLQQLALNPWVAVLLVLAAGCFITCGGGACA